jgi:DNA repair protein RadA/Sms
MKKNAPKTVYVCQHCGHETPKWMGRCPGCGEWNGLVEEIRGPLSRGEKVSPTVRPHLISEIPADPENRMKTGIREFDRTLGGGIVDGSLVLIGGEPGIGKSTLVLQMAGGLSQAGARCLYLSGEESPRQIKMRADRLSVHMENLYVATGTCLETLLMQVDDMKPDVFVVDSIQTIYTETFASAPGSVGQIREVSSRFQKWAKESGTPTFLVGHVTKEGAIAGPKVLEHIVDTVLYFEGDRSHQFRILRSVKNRYGPTNEIGVFAMKESGLEEVGNPSRLFLEERPEDVSGSVVIPCLEGTRPLLVEVQALVGPGSMGMPRRTSMGVDHNRISLLVAVLAKRLGLEMGDQDIFVNVAGGLKVIEPAVDLGIISALVSSFRDRPVDRDLVVFGEVGLAGEVRGVGQPELRIREAKKLGFSKCLLPKTNHRACGRIKGMQLFPVNAIGDLLDILFENAVL